MLPFVSQIKEMDKRQEHADGEDGDSAVNYSECDSQGFLEMCRLAVII